MFTMALWNKKNLEPPLVNTYKTSPQEIGEYSSFKQNNFLILRFLKIADVEPLTKIFREASTFFSNQTLLEQEAALLSRCIYRTKTKFRLDKGYKELQKLNRAVLQYLNMNFVYHVQNFSEMLPDSNEQIFYLPTKNMLDYILVRLEGILRLMGRVIECAKNAALCMEQKLPLAQFWKIDFISIALVSRLRALAIDILKFTWRFFKIAVSYSSLLKNTGPQWLSNDYIFSLIFKDYVDVEIGLHEENSEIQLKQQKQNIIKQAETKNSTREQTFSEIFASNKNVITPQLLTAKKKVKNETTKGANKNNLSINTPEDLERFLNSENSKRESSQKLCYLNNLNNLQWNIVRKQLKKFLAKTVHKKKEADVRKVMQKVNTVIKKAKIS